MYVLTDKDDKIIEISNSYKLDEEHRNIELDNHNIAYGPDEKINVYEVEEVPQGVVANKYCYTEEKGFYENENYKEPEPSDAQKIKDLQDEVTNLQLALLEAIEGGM